MFSESNKGGLNRRKAMKAFAATTGGASLFSNSAFAAPSSDDLTWKSVIEIRDMVASREISAVEVTRHFLARIEKFEPFLHAFLYIDHDGAISEARRIDSQLARGAKPGPLAGVPIALKDQSHVKGMPTTAGSLIFANLRSSFDGTIAERLRAAGAIIVGKTSLPEFAGWPRTKNYLGGETLNPWDLTRIAGASSGGSAAAVAAGMVPAAIATDGGGSTRIPAALCGMVGLLPTIGRIPDFAGFRFGIDGSAGPLARNVEDAALIQQIIAGPDKRVPSSINSPAPDVISGLKAGVGGIRIAWSPDFGRIPIEALIVNTVKRAVAALSAAGAEIDELAERVEHPWGDGSLTAGLQDAVAQGDWDSPPTGSLPELEGFEASLIENSEGAGAATSAIPAFQNLIADHRLLLTPSQRIRNDFPPNLVAVQNPEILRAQLDRIFRRFDVICTPTMNVVAPVARPGWGSPYDDYYMGTNFTFIANATHCPAISVPCGYVRDLPVGLQIIGKHGDEAMVLRVAQMVQNALPIPLIPPLARL